MYLYIQILKGPVCYFQHCCYQWVYFLLPVFSFVMDHISLLLFMSNYSFLLWNCGYHLFVCCFVFVCVFACICLESVPIYCQTWLFRHFSWKQHVGRLCLFFLAAFETLLLLIGIFNDVLLVYLLISFLQIMHSPLFFYFKRCTWIFL